MNRPVLFDGVARRCDHWGYPKGPRCTADAEVWLLTPDGRRVPGGPLCRAHAEACVSEYREKLGESWGIEEPA